MQRQGFTVGVQGLERLAPERHRSETVREAFGRCSGDVQVVFGAKAETLEGGKDGGGESAARQTQEGDTETRWEAGRKDGPLDTARGAGGGRG